ncbi:MAG: 23S rRNA (pseudouridine(1915)-N(3))-methyltransferase RlmH [Ponticaulis sp.]|nr:23S rRNA (pseudouridine(1915)-N(3))-methyltransferase RlmH [Ponticaulis sp.]
MRITLLTIGKIKKGPERDLVDDYLSRARKLGRQLGVRDVQEVELEAGGRQADECAALLEKIPAGATILLLDERGQNWTSTAFSDHLEKLKDQGCPDLVFMIGGADGFTDEVKTQYRDKICFGSMTWPHKLVRVLAAEQIYRALSLMAGTPYHRE